MPQYQYRAYDTKGKTITGTTIAENETAALTNLTNQNLIPYAITNKDATANTTGSVPNRLLPLITRQLATVLSSGTQLSTSLDMLAKQPLPAPVTQVLRNLVQDIRTGLPFSEALAKHKSSFTSFYVQMIKVGEATGGLDHSLERIADHLEKIALIRSKLVGALTYPVSVLVIGLTLAFAMLRFVVPQFAGILQGFGSELPLSTRVLMSVSDFVAERTLVIIAPLLAAAAGFFLLRRSENGRAWLGAQQLALPLFGNLITKGEMSMLASTMATAVESGSPLVTAIELGTGSTSNTHVQRSLKQVRTDIERGSSLKAAFEKHPTVFPPLFISMIAIGEESGNLPGMLTKIATFYDREVESTSNALIGLLQPAFILVLGVLIGGMAYALFEPVFSLVVSGPESFRR